MHRTYSVNNSTHNHTHTRSRAYKRLPLLALFCVLAAAPGHASVYKVVDERGNITYTDTPPAGTPQSEPVELPTINRQPATEVRPASRSDSQAQKHDRVEHYRHAAIRSPVHDSTLPAGASHLAVAVDLEPALQEGHWVQVLIDGSAVGSPLQSTQQSVQDLERGMHFLSVQVLDSNGNVVAETEPVTIHVQRPVVGGPASGQPRPPGAVVPRRSSK